MKDLEAIKKLDFKKLLMAVALTACLVNSAHAAEPKATVLLSKDVLTVGDVFDDVDHDADHVLAPAPNYGDTMTLSTYDLKRISDAFNLGWVPQTNREQATVRRNAHEVDHFAIETALKKSLGAELKGQKFDLQLADRNLHFHLPEGTATDLDVSNLQYDLAQGEFHALVTAPAGAPQPAVKQEVSGRLIAVTSVPILKNTMHQGDVITAADLDYTDIKNTDLAANTITDASKIIGMTPRRGIVALKPLNVGDISMPVIIKKGDLVTITLKSPVMTLTTTGRALENAASGDSLRVMNVTSNQTLDAMVTGPKAVSVNAPAEALAMN